MSLEDLVRRVASEIRETQKNYDDLVSKVAELELEKKILEAELRGLEEQHKVLAAGLEDSMSTRISHPAHQMPPPVQNADVKKLTLADAIAYVVNESERAMQIEDVIHRLQEHGRADNAASVSSTISYVAKENRIRRVARGLYARPQRSHE